MRKLRSETGRDTRQGIQSIEVGAKLLDVFAKASGPLTLRDLARTSGMPASKAHRYLISLLRVGLARQDRVSGRYDLGENALSLGLSALRRLDAVRFGNEAIIELNQRLDVMIELTVWGTHGPTIISLYNRSELLIANFNVGGVLPLLRSASGRVFVTYLPRVMTASRIENALSQSRDASPPSAVTTLDDVERVIAEVREQGFAITRGDLVAGRNVVAAPIFNSQGNLVAVAAMIGVPDPADDYIAALLDSMNAVSRRLGFLQEQSS